ncbi:hypothetical protein FRC14_002342 [Serendipita sp. 396]|nr:hypothetical protein FRC14_002342 [Serendipita sp. 396]KAG8788629.1 hypothetical protein FRC15_003153 [Serendipita sp. 397]KAG8803927.1 hypothetical protein FRC16_002041 [Serendipita sp. 398]KAG8828083.1 hypothetical protein FRC19_009939 [Serendipita sp. 401]KAG9058394.1 hypothetical protein FS842_010120 [Serendipita sp. 407]
MARHLSPYELQRIVSVECVSKDLTEEKLASLLYVRGPVLKVQFFVSQSNKRHAIVTFERPEAATQALSNPPHDLNVKPFNPSWIKRYEPPIETEETQYSNSAGGSSPSRTNSTPPRGFTPNPYLDPPPPLMYTPGGGFTLAPQLPASLINQRENYLRSTVQKQTTEILNLNKEIARLRKDRSQAWAHTEELNDHIKGITTKHEHTLQEQQRFKVGIGQEFARMKDVEKTNDHLLKGAEMREKALKIELEKARGTIDMLKKDISNKSESLDEHRKALSEAEREIARLKLEKAPVITDATASKTTSTTAEGKMDEGVSSGAGDSEMAMEESRLFEEPITQEQLRQVGPALIQAFRHLDKIVTTAMAQSTDGSHSPVHKKRKLDYL